MEKAQNGVLRSSFHGENMLNRTLIAFRIRLVVVSIVFVCFAVARISSCVLDARDAYNNRQEEQWRNNVTKVRVGMTFDELFNILGKPSVHFEDANGVTLLSFNIPYVRKKKSGLTPYRFDVDVIEGVVSDARMVYR